MMLVFSAGATKRLCEISGAGAITVEFNDGSDRESREIFGAGGITAPSGVRLRV
jgi:hypothetical protein